MSFLEALAAASKRGGITFLAGVLSGAFVGGRLNHVPFELEALLLPAAALPLVVWLVREIVRPRWRDTKIRTTRVRLPSTSGVDFVWDVVVATIGAAFVTTGPSLYGMGLMLLVIPAALSMLRLLFWRRRPTAHA